MQATAPDNAVKVKWSIRLYGLQTTDFDNVMTPLPVELTNFDAMFVGNKVQLNWTTATEVNNYGFEILRRRLLRMTSKFVMLSKATFYFVIPACL